MLFPPDHQPGMLRKIRSYLLEKEQQGYRAVLYSSMLIPKTISPLPSFLLLLRLVLEPWMVVLT